jgi:hypothetical protein
MDVPKQDNKKEILMAIEPAMILASEMRMMMSQHTGRTYRITISLPLGYGKGPDEGWPFNNTPDQWPVVYVLDGNWYAGMVAGIIRPMAWCGSTTDAIVVGIGYEEADNPIEAFWTSFTRRNIDLTPIRDEAAEKNMVQPNGQFVPTGDASGFLRFYRTKLAVKMYLYVGELEEDAKDTTMTDTLRLAAILQGRKYAGFSLVKHVFPDQNHCEVAAPGFQAGLKFALKTR